MAQQDWVPFRPDADDLKAVASDVADIPAIQQTLLGNHKRLCCPDRVAHEYQIAGSRVTLEVARELPAAMQGVGLFHPGARHLGIGRVSTGLGTPHLETNPDFLGIMLAFQTGDGKRVDFLGINDPASPTDNHRDFVALLHATGASAGAEPLLGAEWGEYDVATILAEQKELFSALKDRMGLLKAGKTLAHVTKQCMRTFFSSTAYQPYWTGIVELSGTVGKFTLLPATEENRKPGFRPGRHHLSEEWKRRQESGDIEFRLYWIPFVSEDKTPAASLATGWEEGHRQFAGNVSFPRTDAGSSDARLWAILASEMGANPGNWIHDGADSIREPATEFGVARKIAYQLSQSGRGALEQRWYRSVFEMGAISAELAAELSRRQSEKDRIGHVSSMSEP